MTHDPSASGIAVSVSRPPSSPAPQSIPKEEDDPVLYVRLPADVQQLLDADVKELKGAGLPGAKRYIAEEALREYFKRPPGRRRASVRRRAAAQLQRRAEAIKGA